MVMPSDNTVSTPKLLWTHSAHVTAGQSTSTSTSSYDNCMSLGGDRLQVAWTVNRQEEMVDFLLCGCAQDESV